MRTSTARAVPLSASHAMPCATERDRPTDTAIASILVPIRTAASRSRASATVCLSTPLHLEVV
eukprot:EW703853.1.p3 GENE.EW703853.1~~EW703853.1.p3  ORF type:complete len:63 (+),score=7.44 EW703853.1:104-292(+)